MYISNLIIIIINIIFALQFNLIKSIKIENSAYHDIVIDIRESVPKTECTKILLNLEEALTSASHHLFTALDGRAYFGSVIINIPQSWPDDCIPVNRSLGVSTGEASDITVTQVNQIFGNRIWTEQFAGCGQQGNQMYVGYLGLEIPTIGKEFVKEWAKYRYGVFDENGFEDDKVYPICYFTDAQHVTGCSDGPIQNTGICLNPNRFVDLVKTIDKKARSSIMFVPQADNVVMFCDHGTHNPYAPTKQNYLCNRRSVLEIILQHSDFEPKNLVAIETSSILSTAPMFNYRRRSLTRYVVVIDESQDIMLRESWSFLRSALRKWVVYDLEPNTEVGIVLANGTAADKILGITSLYEQKNRDLVASFIPYAPSDSRQSGCIVCAIRESIAMLEERKRSNGCASNVVLIIAPGMDFSTDHTQIIDHANLHGTRLSTINFPGVIRRKPLDKLAQYTRGEFFTIKEQKYNSEKSYLNTYFELTSTLSTISNLYYEGSEANLPIEIHRKELLDKINDSKTSKRASRIINGNFFMNDFLRKPSGFFIYTHSAEAPLIQNVELTSPNGITYGTRSDQRMPVKQLTLLANINETGTWTYMIERFNGNPQPHFVQVLATPTDDLASIVKAKAWIKRPLEGGPIIIYCEVKRGGYPVHSALVEVIVTRPDIPCNMTDCRQTLKLLDTGSGDPDITKGDGIYTRYFATSQLGIGIYKFDFYVDDNGNTAYSLQDNSAVQNLVCCGSSIPTKLTRQTTPFQRFLPSITIYVETEDIEAEKKAIDHGSFGRIGDLVCQYLENGKVKLSWTSPDMVGSNVDRYEIKYSTSIIDIIDNFDTAAVIWEHDTPYPHSIGDTTSFLIDINKEPILFGKAIFFAIRPYSKISTPSLAGPISNPVRSYVPNKIKETSPPTVVRNGSDNVFDDFEVDSRNETNASEGDIDIKLKYVIPIVAAIIFVLSVMALYCLVCGFRRRKLKKDVNLKHQTKLTDPSSNAIQHNDSASTNGLQYRSPKDSTNNSPTYDISLNKNEDEQQAIIQQCQQQYHQNFLEQPDHHTVGIPIYHDDEISKKRFSNGMNIAEHYLIEELVKIPHHMEIVQSQHQHNSGIYPNGMGINSSGVSIISSSNNTLTRSHQRPILSPYESWTASQLLHEHERRTSPLDDMMTQSQHDQLSVNAGLLDCGSNGTNNSTAPPVPPLPNSAIDGYLSQQPSYLSYKSHQDGSPPPPTYSTISRQQQIPYNNSLQNSTTNPPGCDKKRRNVTMV